MIKRIIICLICMVLISACDNNASSSNGNRQTDNQRYVPINLETITDTTTGMIISGAIDHNTGEVDAFWIRADRGLKAYRNLEVETRNGYLLRLTHSIELRAGTHPIEFTLDTESLSGNQIAGGLLYLWSPDASQQFTQNPQGTLTIDYLDNEVIGSFSLQVENLSGEQVQINGQFYTEESISAVG